eukprot:6912586-Prymnesium_polylepis.1
MSPAEPRKPRGGAAVIPDLSLELAVPDGVEFVIYLYGGETIGDGSVAHYLRQAGVHTVTVDVRLGGYAHDVRIVSVQRQLMELASRPQCV